MNNRSMKFLLSLGGLIGFLLFVLGYVISDAVNEWSVPEVIMGALAGGLFTLGTAFMSGWFQLQQVKATHNFEEERARSEREREAARSIIPLLDVVDTYSATLLAHTGTGVAPPIGDVDDAINRLITTVSISFPEIENLVRHYTLRFRQVALELDYGVRNTDVDTWAPTWVYRDELREYLIGKYIRGEEMRVPTVGNVELIEALLARRQVRNGQGNNQD